MDNLMQQKIVENLESNLIQCLDVIGSQCDLFITELISNKGEGVGYMVQDLNDGSFSMFEYDFSALTRKVLLHHRKNLSNV